MNVIFQQDTNLVEVTDNGQRLVVTAPGPSVVIDPSRMGPPGPVGPQGPSGDSAATLSYLHTQNAPAPLVQVIHGLSFDPAGVLCKEQDGTIVEPASISYPISGVVEVTFGFSFSGTVRVS